MTGNHTTNMIWMAVVLASAVGALVAQRAPIGTVLRSAIAWAVIILLIVVAVSHRYEIAAVVARVNQSLGIADQQVSGETVRIRMAPDGHFWAHVSLNGVERDMLIDSGATTTAISEATAQAAGIKPEPGIPIELNTANGVVNASGGHIGTLKVGPLTTRDLGVVISPRFGDLDVLGMNFLSRLGSWRVEGKTLILEPDPNPEGKAANAD